MRRLLYLAFIFLFLLNPFVYSDSEPHRLEDQAADLLDAGKGDEALALLKKITEERPEEAVVHMNYGSILFTKARVWFQSGNQNEAVPLFQEAETHLQKAAELAGEKEEALKGQSYYLLGDIYFYVRQDLGKAKEFYEAALKFYPEHSGAKKELERLNTTQI